MTTAKLACGVVGPGLLMSAALLLAPMPGALCHAARIPELQHVTREGSALRDSGSFTEARDRFRVVVELRLRAREPASSVAAWIDSVGATFLDFESNEALAAANELLRLGLQTRQQDPRAEAGELAMSHLNLSTIAEMRAAYAEGVEDARRAIAILATRQDSSSQVLRAVARNRLAHNLYRMDRFEQAIPDLRQAERELIEAGGGLAELWDVQNTLGECSRGAGQVAEAEQSFGRALDTAGRMRPDGSEQRSLTLNNLAGVYRDMERFDRAEPLTRESLELRRNQTPPDTSRLSTATLNLAELLLLQDRPDEALPFYREASRLARRLKPTERAAVPRFLEREALCEWRNGHFANAARGFEEAFEIFTRDSLPRDELFAQAAQDYAEFLADQSRVLEAESLAATVLRIREQSGGPHAYLLAEPLNLLARIALSHEDGDAARARSYAERSLSILDRAPLSPGLRLDAFAVLADVAERSGHSAWLDSILVVSLEAVEALRVGRGGGRSRARFLARVLPIYDRAFDREMAAGNLATAFRLHESSRARVLLDEFSAFEQRVTTDSSESSRREARLRVNLADAQRRVELLFGAAGIPGVGHDEARAVALRQRDSIGREYQREREARWMALPRWREALSQARSVVEIGEIQRRVDASREPLMVYRVSARGTGVFVFLPGRRVPLFEHIQIDSTNAAILRCGSGALDDGRLTELISGPDGAFAHLSSGGRTRRGLSRVTATRADASDADLRRYGLFRAIVPPSVWPRIQRFRSVAIVPDGPLALLPFDALVVAEPRGARSTVAWLDVGPSIRAAASASALAAIDRRQSTAPYRTYRALSIADVDYSGSAADRRLDAEARGWPALPGTRLEAAQLREAMGAMLVDSLVGANATESGLRQALAGHGLVHIATHGFASGDASDILAGLVLARPGGTPVSEDDGLLQLYEMVELVWNCDLVVLSACETTAGHRLPGEGVMALTRGVLAGGARRVIATLWSVDDDASAALIGAFFRELGPGLRSGRLEEVAGALRNAKRRVRAEPRWRDPAYWAAFTLTGQR